MAIKEFIKKEISIDSKDGTMCVIRSRNSNGYVMISIKAEGKQISFTNERGEKDYKTKALELSEMIKEIASNECKLPSN